MPLLFGPNGQPKPTLVALWKEAHSAGAQEAEFLSFWQHYLSKHEFSEERWICNAEIRPEPGARRRVDRGIRFLNSGNEIVIFCWHEAKGNTSPGAVKECEEQALDACKRSLESHAWQSHVFALTTAKTTAKAWFYERDDEKLTALFEEEYIEATSDEGYKISKSFQKMKTLVPAEVAGDLELTRVTRTTSVPSVDSNPPFPRPPTSAAQQQTPARAVAPPPPPTSTKIEDRYAEVRAKRHPNDRQALKIAAPQGWKTVQGWKSRKEDERLILYCDDEKIWTFAESVEE